MKRGFSRVLCFLMIAGMLMTSACSFTSKPSLNPDGSKKLMVYTSFYTMYDFAKKIGGDRIAIENLVPSGTEPHDWEPKARDMSRIEKADVFIYNGAGMESWVDKIISTVKNPNLMVVEASKDLRLIEGHHEGEGKSDKATDHHDESAFDPHVWLNPMLAKKQMEVIKNVFVTADPQNKEYYESNYSDNAKKIDELDKEYREAVAKFSKKEIVVAHEAFSYLCDAYGLTQMAIEGLNADSEPSAARMAEISKFAKDNKVKVIFFEELVSPKVAKVIAKEAGCETDMLNPVEGIQEKDLKAGKEYFSVMRENLNALKKALQ